MQDRRRAYPPAQEPNPTRSEPDALSDQRGDGRPGVDPKPITNREKIRMKRTKVLGLALVAVFAISAVVSATASAVLPAFFHCSQVAKGTGTYPTKVACEKKEKAGEEPREWSITEVVAGSKIKFSTKGGTATLKAAGNTVECEESVTPNEDEITGPKSVTSKAVKFKGCHKGTTECKSTGAAAKEIVTKPLVGEIGYLSSSAKTVGTKLAPSPAGTFVEFTCGTASTTVEGCVVGQDKNVNELTTTSKLIYKELEGHQEFRGFEGATNCELKAFGLFGAVEITEVTMTTAEAVEIRA
jgi:hypothetical protein